jgi:hypothetical protein
MEDKGREVVSDYGAIVNFQNDILSLIWKLQLQVSTLVKVKSYLSNPSVGRRSHPNVFLGNHTLNPYIYVSNTIPKIFACSEYASGTK